MKENSMVHVYLEGQYPHLDITAPIGVVQVEVRADKKVLWIHAEGVTVLRICRITELEILKGE
jgi:hypothetical protein